VSPTTPADPRLAELREQCLASGFVEGLDFHVDGFPTSLSSEHVELRAEPGACTVDYVDMGRHRTVATAATVDAVAAQFVEEVAWLAAGRGRGPYAGQTRPVVHWGAGLSDEEYLAEFERKYGPPR
jgi:hypothetical protein